ncbi:MAG: dihydrofolate reductase family protein [Myxococcaceae bacterium]
MRRLGMFNQVSVDGFFSSAAGDSSWMHSSEPDPEFDEWSANSASGGGALLFGRATFEMMESWWPTEAAKKAMPGISNGMTAAEKWVFSRSRSSSGWANTRFLAGDLVQEVKQLKASGSGPITILGSGSLIGPLLRAGLLDELQLMVLPVLLGAGTALFRDAGQHGLKLARSRTFKNGRTWLSYELPR